MKKTTMISNLRLFSCLIALFFAANVFSPAAIATDSKNIRPTVANWSDLKPTEDQIISSLNILEMLRRHHYLKLPLNDERSSVVYDGYLKTLDPTHSFFLQSDINEFETHRSQFFRLLKYGQLKPGFAIYQRFLQRAQERLEYTIELLDQGIDKINLSSNDELLIDREKTPWLSSLNEQNELWRKRLVDDVLRLKLSDKKDGEIKEILTKRFKNQLKRLRQTSSEDIFQTYINAFAMSYDPHTSYMSPETAENFDINMSLSLEGIGAVLQSDTDYIKVVRLIPAGPADKARLLAPADRIVGVAQDQKEMVDVIGWRIEDAVKLIRGPKGSKVQLEVLPASNPPGDLTTKTITIVRDAIKLEDQAAKKFVLNMDYQGKKRKIGIIELPTFYLDFKAVRQNDPNYKSSTKDVKKLLAELHKEKVEGIIIDLRNNGGGSLQEATELTGLFVPPGPAVQIRDSSGNVAVLDDVSSTPQISSKKTADTTVAYDGPLVILVNRLSASASEIFAGAMQDYNRALIVGNQTFGKGTVQSVQPLRHGEIKLTMAKFYRVSGQSTQHKGVVPDINYPDVIDAEQIGESSLPEAMPWDTIKPALKSVSINPFIDYLTDLKSRHDVRAKKDPDFIFLNNRMDLMKKLFEEKTLSLNEAKRRQQKETNESTLLALENARRSAKGEKLLTKLKELDDEITAEDNSKAKPEKDAYLVESANILLDYLALSDSSNDTK